MSYCLCSKKTKKIPQKVELNALLVGSNYQFFDAYYNLLSFN